MDSDMASEHIYSVSDRRLQDGLTIPDQPTLEATFRLSRRAALVVISAASLGLWAAIAAAISSLVSVLVP